MRATILAAILVFATLIMQYGAYKVFLTVAVVLFFAIMFICAKMIWMTIVMTVWSVHHIMSVLSILLTETPVGQKEVS